MFRCLPGGDRRACTTATIVSSFSIHLGVIKCFIIQGLIDIRAAQPSVFSRDCKTKGRKASARKGVKLFVGKTEATGYDKNGSGILRVVLTRPPLHNSCVIPSACVCVRSYARICVCAHVCMCVCKYSLSLSLELLHRCSKNIFLAGRALLLVSGVHEIAR